MCLGEAGGYAGLKWVLNLHSRENNGEIHFGDILLGNSLTLSSLSDAGDGLLYNNSPRSSIDWSQQNVSVPAAPRK